MQKKFIPTAMLVISTVVAGCLLAAPAAVSKDDMTIKVGIQAVPPDEVYAARDWGARYNLKVDLGSFSSGGDLLQAFVAGRVDVGNGGSGRLVSMAAQQP